jgi:uncharacterized Zn finger protein
MYYDYRPYVSVAERKKKAAQHAKKLAKKGQTVKPVVIEGRKIADSFWGKAWCDNLESYSDYQNRMPRGRTYVRNGSVADLQISAGRVRAIVGGSEVYEIDIEIAALPKKSWRTLVQACSGQIGSVVELLSGKLSAQVLTLLARPKTGLFPSPDEIRLSCSCPDWADMCKHVAAALYGVGARLDREPEIFFTLRQVDQTELVTEAATARSLGKRSRADRKTIADDSLAGIFGIELDVGEPATKSTSAKIATQPTRQAKTKSAPPTTTTTATKRARKLRTRAVTAR